MDLNLIALFAAVADAQSFSEAARKLGVERSSVSRSVAALERDLGVALFARTTRHVALTTTGAALLARLRPHLGAIHDLTTSLPERAPLPSGELRMTAPFDVGITILPPVLARFAERYPEVRLDVHLGSRKVDLVAEGFDVAIRGSADRLADSSLVARKLTPIELQIFAAPSYLARRGTPRALVDTAAHDWVMTQGGRLPRPFPRPATAPRLRSDDMTFVYRAVLAGAGLGIFPSFLAQADCAAGNLVRVLPRARLPAGALHFVHPPARHVSRKVIALRDHLLEHFAQHPLAPRAPAT